ncbi:MAG TPA: STAS domain-containing protein [Bryobacteraceae bacterium]|nr:STAS domain-containing protein [Bryobacteraceae bacterium]
MPLSISTRTCEPGITVIELSGKVTLGRESSQIEPLTVKMLAEGTRKIVFDVSGVTYIDSSGMGQIAFSAGKVTRAGGQCRVAGAAGMVLEVFRITRVDSVVPFADTVEEACAQLGAV